MISMTNLFRNTNIGWLKKITPKTNKRGMNDKYDLPVLIKNIET